MNSLELAGVHQRYARQPVLDGVDLEVEQGSFTAVLGRVGSGKTTLLRVIAGFERIESGVVRLGAPMFDDGRTSLPPERRRIGYVPQDGALFPHLRVAANVGFGLRPIEPAQGRRPARRGRPDRARAALPAPAVGGTAAAGGPGPGPGHRTRGGPARRAVLVAGRRPAGQRAPGGGPHPAGPGDHHRAGHPRPGRGPVDGRPGGGAAGRAHRRRRPARGPVPLAARRRPGRVPGRGQPAARARSRAEWPAPPSGRLVLQDEVVGGLARRRPGRRGAGASRAARGRDRGRPCPPAAGSRPGSSTGPSSATTPSCGSCPRSWPTTSRSWSGSPARARPRPGTDVLLTVGPR